MMPNKTIYVADADLPTFERAQELAGENLSATIVAALRRFVAAEESRASGFSEIVVKVGENSLFSQKQFNGRELAKLRLQDPHTGRATSLVVYETAKGRLALYTRTFPDWAAWGRQWSEKSEKSEKSERWRGKHGSTYSSAQDEDWDWWSSSGSVHRLDVYETTDELREHIPPELYAAVLRALSGNAIEILDI